MAEPAPRRWLAYVTAAVLCLPLGTAFHEVVGHGLVGIIAGGRLTFVDILFLQVYPRLSLHGWRGYYGQCEVQGIPTPAGEQWMQLGGSLSTLFISLVAIAMLHAKQWRSHWTRAALLAAGICWMDLLTYTLPTWGLRRSLFWGGRVAEPYEAAIQLGMSGWFFQACVVIGSLALALLWVQAVRKTAATPPGPSNR